MFLSLHFILSWLLQLYHQLERSVFATLYVHIYKKPSSVLLLPCSQALLYLILANEFIITTIEINENGKSQHIQYWNKQSKQTNNEYRRPHFIGVWRLNSNHYRNWLLEFYLKWSVGIVFTITFNHLEMTGKI